MTTKKDETARLMRRVMNAWNTGKVTVEFSQGSFDISVHCHCDHHPKEGWRVGQDYQIASGGDFAAAVQAAVDAAPKKKVRA